MYFYFLRSNAYITVETVGTLGCVSAGTYTHAQCRSGLPGHWGLLLVKWTKALPTLFLPFSPNTPCDTHTHTTAAPQWHSWPGSTPREGGEEGVWVATDLIPVGILVPEMHS